MILIGRGLDFANDLEINKGKNRSEKVLNQQLCSCQGVKTPQALEEEEKEDGRGLTNQTRGKRGAGCASRSGHSIAHHFRW